MIACIVVCRSVTYAQRLRKMLERAGFTVGIRRIPATIPGMGCGYGVRVPVTQMNSMFSYLNSIDYSPDKIVYEYQNGSLEEQR